MQEYICFVAIIFAVVWLGHNMFKILWPKRSKTSGCGACKCSDTSSHIPNNP